MTTDQLRIADIENRFSYHPPKTGQPAKYERIRATAKELALMLDGLCPQSRELALALTNLDQTVFWANAAIARHGEADPAPEE